MELQKSLIKELLEQVQRGRVILDDYLRYEYFDELVASAMIQAAGRPARIDDGECFGYTLTEDGKRLLFRLASEENMFNVMRGGRV